MTDTAAAPPVRRRPRFRPVEVAAVRPLSARMMSVTFSAASADTFEGFELTAPAQHLKMLFPGPGQHDVSLPVSGPDGMAWPEDRPRPAMRTYTPRRHDPVAGTLEVHFVLHGEGPAAAWAGRAAAGDRLAFAGPGGRTTVPLEPARWVVAGDESAVPAIGTLLEALPGGATAEVYVESHDAPGALEVGSDTVAAHHEVTWLEPDAAGSSGSALQAALAATPLDDGTRVWVACEATAVRRIRRMLLDRGADSTAMVTRGYWRTGETDHPDHDHGED